MRKYEEYVDSELTWLFKYPSNWTIKRIKDIFNLLDYKRIPLSGVENPIYDYYGASGVIDKVDEYIFDGTYILIGEDGANLQTRNKPLAFLAEGKFWVNNHAHILDTKSKYYIRYMVYALENLDYSIYITGAAQPKLSQDNLTNIFVQVPSSFQEQQAIANYLDAKTQAIDKKVSLLEQKIETYKQLKRTLINQTITKGLDKNVPLKDSGISWIGQIPQHWEVKRLKELGNIETSSINKKIEEDEDLVKLVNYTDVYSNLKREIWNNDDYMIVSANKLQISSKKLKQGDVLFTPSSETINDIGVSAVVMENLHNTLYSYHLLRLRFRKVVDLHFKRYLFSNDYVQYYFSKSATGTTRKILGLNTFNNLEVPLPPKSEQEKIAKYLDHKTATIDAIVSNIGKQIEMLKQLRKTLINDVVTGKIMVAEQHDYVLTN